MMFSENYMQFVIYNVSSIESLLKMKGILKVYVPLYNWLIT